MIGWILFALILFGGIFAFIAGICAIGGAFVKALGIFAGWKY